MGKAMFSPNVVCTDSFLDLPEEAQLLYYRLGFEGSYGKIVGIRRIARGFGASAEALGALYELGYLFDYGDACWVRHYWINNTFKAPNNNGAKLIPEIGSGEIGFEGEPFKSAFRCPRAEKPSISLIQGYTVTGAVTDPASVAEAATDSVSETGSVTSTDASTGAGEEACGEGDGLHPCRCRKCKSARATYRNEGAKVIVRCPNCGEYEHSYSD